MIVKAPSVQIDCSHCGLPVPKGLVEPDRTEQFCCSGCAGAFQLIHSNGLDSFYEMSSGDSQQRTFDRRQEKPKRFAEFDEPVFHDKFVKSTSEHGKSIELAIDGIHCAACVWLIEKLPQILPGVTAAQVNWARATVVLRWQQEQTPLSKIASTLDQLGYSPRPIHQSKHENRFRLENRRHLINIAIAAAIAGNNMLISAALYLGMFAQMSAGMSQLLRIASCGVGLAALLIPGRVFLKSAISAIRTKTPHMDLPIALALTVGTIAGTVNVIRGIGEIYFDSLAVLIFLLLVGRWIQFRQQCRAANSIELLYRLTPQTTKRIVDGQAVETLVDLVSKDDLLQIETGDLFPVDAEIITGSTAVDESILTGESKAVQKTVGEFVAAGTSNVGSRVVVRVNAIGNETRLGKIVELVEQASLEKPKIVQWANRIGGYFVVAVMLLAAVTLSWWWATGAELAIERTIALLIVACPCALALATPLAIGVALGQAAKNRIMVKGGDVLQALQNRGTIWLDKTGTLTQGDLKVEQWHGDLHWLKIAAELEQHASHPVANAIVQYAEQTAAEQNDDSKLKHRFQPEPELCRSQVGDITTIAGGGIRGRVGDFDVLIGNAKLLKNQDIAIESRHTQIANQIVASGYSPCWMVVDDRVVAIAAIGDSIRPDAVTTINKLGNLGWRIGILSGDHPEIVNRVAKRLGINSELAHGGVCPEEKLALVQENSKHETVVMVGDGVNDSAALAAATVGIAVKNGAEASLAAAPVYLAEPGLSPVMQLIQISKSTQRTMAVNFAVSIGYNLTFAALAFSGLINPLVAAIVMPISSLTVVSLSLGAGRIRKQGSKA